MELVYQGKIVFEQSHINNEILKRNGQKDLGFGLSPLKDNCGALTCNVCLCNVGVKPTYVLSKGDHRWIIK